MHIMIMHNTNTTIILSKVPNKPAPNQRARPHANPRHTVSVQRIRFHVRVLLSFQQPTFNTFTTHNHCVFGTCSYLSASSGILKYMLLK